MEHFSCDEWRNQENHCLLAKLESKKQAQKEDAQREGLVRQVTFERVGSSHVPLLAISPIWDTE